MKTILGAFSVVLDYGHYRLANMSQNSTPGELQNMYRIKAQIEGLKMSLAVFDGFQHIKLLEFPASLKEEFDAFGKSEAVAVQDLAFFLSDDARECYMSHRSPGAAQGNQIAPTWPHVVHALLQRFLIDDVLQTAYDAATRATQETNEDELAFAQRIEEAGRVYRHVFTPVEMVNC